MIASKPALRFLVIALFISANLPCLQAQDAKTQTDTKPVPVQSVAILSPENSSISFVGIHVGDDPKPRLGGFKQFQGYAVVDPTNNTISSIVIDINVDSVWTQFEKLTGHLKNADFFETDKFPTSRFVSTSIKKGAKGQCEVTGDLTLHGQTASISFPAKYEFSEGGLILTSKFNLDRSQFGMKQMLSGVDKMVEVEISLGQKTEPSEEQQGHGGGKKKQSKSDSKTQFRQVSIKLPNMT
jgi:polyisoprenoid-binding protein YceI